MNTKIQITMDWLTLSYEGDDNYVNDKLVQLITQLKQIDSGSFDQQPGDSTPSTQDPGFAQNFNPGRINDPGYSGIHGTSTPGLGTGSQFGQGAGVGGTTTGQQGSDGSNSKLGGPNQDPGNGSTIPNKQPGSKTGAGDGSDVAVHNPGNGSTTPNKQPGSKTGAGDGSNVAVHDPGKGQNNTPGTNNPGNNYQNPGDPHDQNNNPTNPTGPGKSGHRGKGTGTSDNPLDPTNVAKGVAGAVGDVVNNLPHP